MVNINVLCKSILRLLPYDIYKKKVWNFKNKQVTIEYSFNRQRTKLRDFKPSWDFQT